MSSGLDWHDVIMLKAKLGTILVPIVFWLIAIGAFIAGLKLIFTGGPWLGLIILVGVPLFARIVCEAVISIFEINASLKNQK